MTALDRYQLLANAVAARHVPLLLSQTDEQPSTDGETITIPATLLHDHERCWLALVAQAALLAGRSLQPQRMKQLVGKRTAQRRYLSLEAMRLREVLADRLPPRFTDHPEWSPTLRRSDSPQQSLERALKSEAVPPAPSFFGELRPLGILRRTLSTEGFHALSAPSSHNEFDAAEEQSTSTEAPAEESRLLRLLASPWGGTLSKLLAKMLGESSTSDRTSEHEANSSSELAIASFERNRRLHRAPTVEARVELAATSELPAATEYIYPEWNYATESYREQWVFAATATAERIEGPRDLTAMLSTNLTAELRRRIATLGLSYELHGRQPDGTDLDLSPLIEAAIDHAAGYVTHAPRVYRAARRTRRDLGVCIVLDVSGSTGEGQTTQSNQFDQQLEVAWHLGAAFDTLGDTVEMFGFHSWGRSIVRWLPLKSYDERWSSAVKDRFAQLEPSGFTRLGAAIRHAHHRLTTVIRLPYRLILLVTDGLPYDQEYEGEYARADVRKALAEAHAAGIACLCICVGADADSDKLHAVFDGKHVINIDEPAQLQTRIVAHCRRALSVVSKRDVRSHQVA
ncbi:MAG: VWA domain-containing protein [Steroidobacteraceae bacterium]